MALLAEQMRSFPDLERGICRAYYRKIGPSEFFTLLTAFEKYVHLPFVPTPFLLIELHFYRIGDLVGNIHADKSIKSPLLRDDLFGSFPELKRVTLSFLRVLNKEACLENDKKSVLKPEQFPSLNKFQMVRFED